MRREPSRFIRSEFHSGDDRSNSRTAFDLPRQLAREGDETYNPQSREVADSSPMKQLSQIWESCLPRFAVWRRIAAPWLFFLTAVLTANLPVLAQPKPAELGAGQQRRVGRLIRVTAPITDNVTKRAVRMASGFISQAKQREEWPVIIFEIQPGASDFGQAYDLATKIAELDGATTIAYIPKDPTGKSQALRGHAVLVALACEWIAMAGDAQIGEANADQETISDVHRAGYKHIAELRRTVPIDLALGMLDPALEVLEVRTPERDFVRSDRLEEYKRNKTVEVKGPVIEAGTVGLFSGDRAVELGIVDARRFLVPDLQTLASNLGLGREAIEEDPSLEGGWRAMQFPIRGEFEQGDLVRIQEKIREKINEEDVNLVILRIDSRGGDLKGSLDVMMQYLSELDPGRVRTVAFIEEGAEAGGDAAFVALGCDHVVMHPDATIGGGIHGIDEIAPADLEGMKSPLRDAMTKKGRNWSLPEAILDRGVKVYQYQRKSDGYLRYFSEAEALLQPNKDDWTKGPEATKIGERFKATGVEAEKYRLATALVQDFEKLKAMYGVHGEVPSVEPDWVDTLLAALRHPAVLTFLLMVGMFAFYAEMQSPGSGVGGFIAVVCFVVFFWGQFLGGTAGWLEILLFSLGVVCVLIEIFVLPGVGICGIGGGILILISLVLAMQTFSGLPESSKDLRQLRTSLLVVTAAGFGATFAFVYLRRYLPRSRRLSGLVLATPDQALGEEGLPPLGSSGRFDHLMGAAGKAQTPLTPAGKALIEGDLVDVVTGGEFVEKGSAIVVVETIGHRVVVRAVDA